LNAFKASRDGSNNQTSVQNTHHDPSQTTNQGSNQYSGHTQNGNQSSGGLNQTSNGLVGSGKALNTDTTSSRSQQTTNQSNGSTTTKGVSSNLTNQNSQWSRSNTSTDTKSLSGQHISFQASSTICPGCGKNINECPSSGAIFDDFRQPPSITGIGMSGSKSEQTSTRGGHTTSQTESRDYYHSSNQSSSLGQGVHSSNQSSSLGQGVHSSFGQKAQSQDRSLVTRDSASGVCIACGQPACPFSQSIFQDFQGRHPVANNKEGFPYFWPGSVPLSDLQSR
jgi:hypothetical protein